MILKCSRNLLFFKFLVFPLADEYPLVVDLVYYFITDECLTLPILDALTVVDAKPVDSLEYLELTLLEPVLEESLLFDTESWVPNYPCSVRKASQNLTLVDVLLSVSIYPSQLSSEWHRAL